MKKGFCKSMISALIIGAIAISSIGIVETSKKASATVNYTPTGKYGAGVSGKIPDQINAPFVDMGWWVNDPVYSNNGASKIIKFSQDTGVKYFNLGFIQGTGGVSNGIVDWGWGGYSVLSERDQSNAQYKGIKKSIKEIRDAGGDVIISFGGLNGKPFWKVTQDITILENTYLELIDGYGLTRIDLDIEAQGRGKAENIANAKALKKVQEKTGIEVVLTLPVMPEGLISVDMDSFDAYLSEGVDIKMINVMTMCYGTSSIKPGETYATASVRAIENLKNQIQTLHKKYGITLTDEEAYLKCGTTVSIGFEGSAHPYWGTDYSRVVVDHAKSKEIGMTSFWSMNRDALIDTGGQVKVQYEHTKIFKEFGKLSPDPDPNPNFAPVFSGIENKTISLGSYFNPLYMVGATDKEDGELTDNIVVAGTVNNKVAGDYQLTYSVADSRGKKTIKTRTIKVVKGAVIEGEQWDKSKVYDTGDIVVYDGAKFEAKWWTQGEAPDKSKLGDGYVWKLIEEGGSVPKPDITDLAAVAAKYNIKKGQSGWELKHDLNVDKIVDLYDLVIVAIQM